MINDPGNDSSISAHLNDSEVASCLTIVKNIRNELDKIFVGQEELVSGVITALIANGHVMVESLPGLGKTLLVKGISKIIGLDNNRIQFTPDLMPSDITGSHVFDMAERKFVFHKGPVFTQFLLADEFNRAPAKTHSALLEVMQEGQITLDGTTHTLQKPFFVMATQNPIENEGTYNLPEAQLDRFLFKLVIEYPQENEEKDILNMFLAGTSPYDILEHQVQAVSNAEQMLHLQGLAKKVTVDESIIQYITQIVRSTRSFPGIYLGASPRASIALLTSSRALALMSGRNFVVPDDVKDVVIMSLRHRIILSPEAEIEGKNSKELLGQLIQSIEVPRAH
ncbi:MAG: MoxR family ATPase [Planctomycetes bacterium]|nr:MoxR family ATPase [Planctomycetota bacterium]